MNPEHVRILVARRMQQATEALEDGRYLLAAGRTECVRTGRLPKELSAALHQLFDARQEDDYRRLDPVLPEEATEFIAVAEQFVQAIRAYMLDTGYLPRE